MDHQAAQTAHTNLDQLAAIMERLMSVRRNSDAVLARQLILDAASAVQQVNPTGSTCISAISGLLATIGGNDLLSLHPTIFAEASFAVSEALNLAELMEARPNATPTACGNPLCAQPIDDTDHRVVRTRIVVDGKGKDILYHALCAHSFGAAILHAADVASRRP